MQSVEETLEYLQQRHVIERIWRGDHTLWKPRPEEITDRLGWLCVTDLMQRQVPTLKAFAEEVRGGGYRHVVLLGMGGSSLGPEVISKTFGSAQGYPEMVVLDSTVPACVRAVSESIDAAHTLFLVSSKSGSTVEPNCLYKHFRSVVEQSPAEGQAGNNFVAITDQGSSLDELALAHRFRRAFLNPSDIGGRYSVLSYFGLVPAALIGVGIEAIMDRADSMRAACASSAPIRDNPGAWLGAVMGALAVKGRDKLTIVVSPSISSFGLWVEQLIAESTGKEGTGIIPVASEPVLAPVSYGDDRLFVYLRLEGDDNSANDVALADIESSGHPVVRLRLNDLYDLGAEFFRWELATAVAASILGINPFDQPDVQSAKEQTEAALREFRASGRMPQVEESGSIEGLLSEAGSEKYLAIMAFVRQTPAMDRALAGLRRRVAEQHHIATTLGYGPRFLHSTGQLHKGGPVNGLFLQLTADHIDDVPVPGEPYTFGVLADAQAIGDLRTLAERRRRVARVQLGADVEAEVRRLAEELG